MKEPAQEDVEYVLVYDYPCYAKTSAEVLVPRDTVVNNVNYRRVGSTLHQNVLGGSSELEFTVKATGKSYTTNYGYMFALATLENLEKLDAYRQADREAKRAAAHAKASLDDVRTVAGPFEGVFAAVAKIRTVKVSVGWDGGTNWAVIPENEWHRVRDQVDKDGKTYQEAEVSVGGDGGGSIKEWVRI